MNKQTNRYQHYVPRDRVDYLNTLLEQAVKAVGNIPIAPGGISRVKDLPKELDPGAMDAPFLGAIRRLTHGTNEALGGERPAYARQDLPPAVRLSDALTRYGENFMGAHGGFGKLASPSIPNTTMRPVDRLLSHEGAPDRARVEFYKKWLEDGNETSPLRVMKEAAGWGVEDGKHRLQAYKELGHRFVPTVDVANLSDDAKRAIDKYDDYLQRHARKLTK